MKNLLTQIKNEWRSNLFLLVELLLVFAVLWYIVDWVTVTARVYRAPMGFDTEHCYNLSFSTLTPKSALYNPDLTVENNIDALLEITERLRHRQGVEAVSISQNCYPYNEGMLLVNSLMLQEEERCICLSVLFLIRLFIIFYVNMRGKKMRFQVCAI